MSMQQYQFIYDNNEETLLLSDLQNKNKYKKILDNLLNISSRDSSIFFKENKINTDLFQILDENDIKEIATNSKFKIKLKKIDSNVLIEELQQMNDYNELYKFVSKIKISNKTKLKNEIKKKAFDLASFKDAIKEGITNEEKSFISNWKRISKKINDVFAETNIWNLFIGTFFIKNYCERDGASSPKPIYAPLLLKEIDILIEKNNVYLISRNEEIILNEKAIFFIEQSRRIVFPKIKTDVKQQNLLAINYEINDFLKDIIKIVDFDILQPLEAYKAEDIKNSSLDKVKGITLVFCNPGGNILRNVVLDLIKQDKISSLLANENILDTFDHEINMIEKVINKREPIARICQTDLSQEKAIFSALEMNSIIKGPPGTGKSQTIANILANIMLEGKTALVISEKKVALEVLLKRMSSLAKFILPIFEYKQAIDGEDIKKNFYKKFSDILDSEKNYLILQYEDTSKKPYITSKIANYWSSMDEYDIDRNAISLYALIKNNIDFNKLSLLENTLVTYAKIDDSFKKFLNWNITVDELAEKFNIKKIYQKIIENKKIKQNVFQKILKRPIKEFRQEVIIHDYPRDWIEKANYLIGTNKNLRELQINVEFLEYLHKVGIDEFKRALCIRNIYEQQDILLKNETFFVNHEKSIYKKLYQQFRKRCEHLNSQKINSFRGSIERQHLLPKTFIKKYKDILKKLFDVIISTPDALANFIDFKTEKYDYVIFDEASQIFLEKAIPYISIGSKVIIAGDEQQMQPTNWFGIRADDEDDEEELIEENIDSLLTYAIQKNVPSNLLELNYRCSSAELTTFSSNCFYDSKLKSLDKNQLTKESIEIIDINGSWKDNSNQEEVVKCVEILKKNIKKYEKIILLTLNQAQEKLFDWYISEKHKELYEEIINGKVILKRLENIQGDEADLVIVSVAYTKDAHLASTYVARPGGRNALNVAITRAKDKMIVVKSIKSKDIKISNQQNKDLTIFKQWIEFLELNSDERRNYAPIVSNNGLDSEFEADVLNWLKTQNFPYKIKIQTQYCVGSYRIDLAILNAKNKAFILGIEIDGYKYHSTPYQRYNDFLRQSFIESKGYHLIRIPEIKWANDKQSIIDKINHHLSQHFS